MIIIKLFINNLARCADKQLMYGKDFFSRWSQWLAVPWLRETMGEVLVCISQVARQKVRNLSSQNAAALSHMLDPEKEAAIRLAMNFDLPFMTTWWGNVPEALVNLGWESLTPQEINKRFEDAIHKVDVACFPHSLNLDFEFFCNFVLPFECSLGCLAVVPWKTLQLLPEGSEQPQRFEHVRELDQHMFEKHKLYFCGEFYCAGKTYFSTTDELAKHNSECHALLSSSV